MEFSASDHLYHSVHGGKDTGCRNSFGSKSLRFFVTQLLTLYTALFITKNGACLNVSLEQGSKDKSFKNLGFGFQMDSMV